MNLAIGPSSDPGSALYGLDPANTFTLTNAGVRYIGFEIGSRYPDTDPYTNTAVGLAQVRITATAVPEPGMALLGGLGFAMFLRRRR